MASVHLVTNPAWTPTIQTASRVFTKYSLANSATVTQSKTPPIHSTSFPAQYSLSVLTHNGTSSVTLKTSLNIQSNNISKHYNPIIYSSENSNSHRWNSPGLKSKRMWNDNIKIDLKVSSGEWRLVSLDCGSGKVGESWEHDKERTGCLTL